MSIALKNVILQHVGYYLLASIRYCRTLNNRIFRLLKKLVGIINNKQSSFRCFSIEIDLFLFTFAICVAAEIFKVSRVIAPNVYSKSKICSYIFQQHAVFAFIKIFDMSKILLCISEPFVVSIYVCISIQPSLTFYHSMVKDIFKSFRGICFYILLFQLSVDMSCRTVTYMCSDFLIAKLYVYGFSKELSKLIKSYLANRWRRTQN